MSQIIPLKLIHFSSEDDLFPAKNLLNDSTDSHWKCKTGSDKEAFIEFELDRMTYIHSVEVRNSGSASIEILASLEPDCNLHSLLPSTPLMSTREAISGDIGIKSRIFDERHFCGSTLRRPWKRVRVLCSQPFRKTTSFGLSLLRVSGSDEMHSDSTVQHHRSIEVVNKVESMQPTSTFTPKGLHCKTNEPLTTNNGLVVPPRENLYSETSSSVPTESNTPMKSDVSVMKREEIQDISNDKNLALEPMATLPNAKGRSKPPCSANILSGVCFALSGFQNPERSDLRDHGLSLGARYRPTWGPGCTHLICAFANTAKFKEVGGNGIIVSKQWITDCYDQKKHLHWRDYRLRGIDNPTSSSKRSFHTEDVESPIANKRHNDGFDQECDTDDEIENAVKEMEEGPSGLLGLPALPSIFSGINFLFYGIFESNERRLMQRLLRAFGGTVSEYMSTEVSYVLTRAPWGEAFDEALEENGTLRFVDVEWLYECDRRRLLCPLEDFEILRGDRE